MLNDLIHFTTAFKHVEKAFLAAKTAKEAIEVLVANKFAITWHMNNQIIEHFESKKTASKPETETEDKGNL